MLVFVVGNLAAKNINPVFVVGVFRSGTSLLHSLLNQHSDIGLMYEADVWHFPPFLQKLRFRRNWLQRQEFYNEVLTRHRLIFGGNLHGFENVHTPGDLYRIYGDLKGARLNGEKSPFYCSQLPHILRQYPDAAFILLWRNPVETYRSVLRAGRTSHFFGQPGMLNRMIYCQEEMIRRAAQLESAGVRIHNVSYAQMVDDTEKVCRGICAFLGVEFDPRMLQLSNADLSSVYHAPHHNFLRRGVIERQEYPEQFVSGATVAKLERYRTRWQRLKGPWFGGEQFPAAMSEPGLMERSYHAVAGRIFNGFDLFKRLTFEFLPIDWLRAYRVLKRGFQSRPKSSPSEIAAHWPSIISTALYLAGLAYIHSQVNPHLIFVPFYAVPCAALTLIINRRWGTFMALAGAIIGPVLQWLGDDVYRSPLVLVWNCIMRFAILMIIVLLLDRIHGHVDPNDSSQKLKN